MANFCSNCGSPLKPGAVFCGSCGAVIQASSAQQVQQPVQRPAYQQPIQQYQQPVYQQPVQPRLQQPMSAAQQQAMKAMQQAAVQKAAQPIANSVQQYAQNAAGLLFDGIAAPFGTGEFSMDLPVNISGAVTKVTGGFGFKNIFAGLLAGGATFGGLYIFKPEHPLIISGCIAAAAIIIRIIRSAVRRRKK